MSDPFATRPPTGRPRPFRFPPVERRTLTSGARLVCAPMRRLPLATITLVLRGTSAAGDEEGREGLADLTAALLLEGTAKRDGAALAEAFEGLGTAVTSAADWDSTVVAATVHPANLEAASTLLREVVRSPAFPLRECDRLKAEHRAARQHLMAEPRELADAALAWILYGTGSRYRRPLTGTTETVSRLTRDDAAALWASRTAAQTTTVILAGDVAPDEAADMAASITDGWHGAAPASTDVAAPPRFERSAVHIVAKADAAQCELRVGHVGVPRSHPDYFPLTVMNAILGGVFSSRINLNLRERHGYTYGAHSGFDWRRGAGPFAVSAAVQTEAAAAAAREILGEIERIRASDVAPQELSLATSYLAGVFPLRFETTSAVAGALAMQETFELDTSYFDTYRDAVRAVRIGDVRRVANEHLQPSCLQIVAVGDERALTPQLAALGLGQPAVYTAADIERAP